MLQYVRDYGSFDPNTIDQAIADFNTLGSNSEHTPINLQPVRQARMRSTHHIGPSALHPMTPSSPAAHTIEVAPLEESDEDPSDLMLESEMNDMVEAIFEATDPTADDMKQEARRGGPSGRQTPSERDTASEGGTPSTASEGGTPSGRHTPSSSRVQETAEHTPSGTEESTPEGTSLAHRRQLPEGYSYLVDASGAIIMTPEGKEVIFAMRRLCCQVFRHTVMQTFAAQRQDLKDYVIDTLYHDFPVPTPAPGLARQEEWRQIREERVMAPYRWEQQRRAARARIDAGSSHHLGSGGWDSFDEDFQGTTGRAASRLERSLGAQHGLAWVIELLDRRGGESPYTEPLTRAELSDPPQLERDGALVRYCRVDENCSQRNRAWEKRVDLIHHVKKCHGLIIEVPRKSAGRPKGDQKSKLPNGSQSHRQTKTQFQSLETRIKLSRNKHIKDLNANAKKRWKLSSLNGKIPYEQWLKNYVHEEMEKWENDMPSRVAKMKANIAKGYKAMSRKYKSNDEKEEDPNEENMENTQHEDDTLTFSESMETHGEEDEETLHTPSLNEVVDKVSPTKKTLKSKTHIPIDISSPSGSICAIDMARSPNVHTYFERYGLEVTFDVKLAREITNKKASSQAMNFFVMWIEHMFEEDTLKHVWFVDSLWLSFMETLPSDRAMRNYFGRVDLSNRMFTFFPIVDE
ncbi:hypothetical protein L7F22_000359 [Adiantum nelumboides]|nr:hypothetical protein [Adiantum nelumboides]